MFPISRQTSSGSRHSRSRAGSSVSGTEAHFQSLQLSTTSRSHSVSASPSALQPQREFVEASPFIQGATTTNYHSPRFDSGSSAAVAGGTPNSSRSRLQNPPTEAWPATASADPLEADPPIFQLDPGTADYNLNSSFGQGSGRTDPYAQEDMK